MCEAVIIKTFGIILGVLLNTVVFNCAAEIENDLSYGCGEEAICVRFCCAEDEYCSTYNLSDVSQALKLNSSFLSLKGKPNCRDHHSLFEYHEDEWEFLEVY